MLVEFSVKNFTSIKNEITFSMVAGSGDENLENTIKSEKSDERYLRTTAIYGANASGKTNFNRALTAAIMMIRKSNQRMVNEPLVEMQPFKFDSKTVNEPCEFKFIFIKNSVKYIYGFSADRNKIHTEYLYYYSSAKPSLVFDRKNTSEYKFTKSEQSKLEELSKKNTEKKLFLATATEWNYEKTKDAYLWFAEDIDTYDNYIGISLDKFDADKENNLRDFTINLLKNADIHIKDYSFESRQVNNNPFLLGNVIVPGMPIQKEAKISTFHEIENEEGKREVYEIDLTSESLGTQSLFFFSPILKEALEKGRTIIIDEIDKSFHPLLVLYIIKLFNNSEINKNNAQLIFNTHDTNLLSLDNFRRDQIWFTEKDLKNGITDMYPLDDFSVRKTENIQKGYLNGRYGAIPFITVGNSLWED